MCCQNWLMWLLRARSRARWLPLAVPVAVGRRPTPLRRTARSRQRSRPARIRPDTPTCCGRSATQHCPGTVHRRHPARWSTIPGDAPSDSAWIPITAATLPNTLGPDEVEFRRNNSKLSPGAAGARRCPAAGRRGRRSCDGGRRFAGNGALAGRPEEDPAARRAARLPGRCQLERTQRRDQRHRHRAGGVPAGADLLGRAFREDPSRLDLCRRTDSRPGERHPARCGRCQRGRGDRASGHPGAGRRGSQDGRVVPARGASRGPGRAAGGRRTTAGRQPATDDGDRLRRLGGGGDHRDDGRRPAHRAARRPGFRSGLVARLRILPTSNRCRVDGWSGC